MIPTRDCSFGRLIVTEKLKQECAPAAQTERVASFRLVSIKQCGKHIASHGHIIMARGPLATLITSIEIPPTMLSPICANARCHKIKVIRKSALITGPVIKASIAAIIANIRTSRGRLKFELMENATISVDIRRQSKRTLLMCWRLNNASANLPGAADAMVAVVLRTRSWRSDGRAMGDIAAGPVRHTHAVDTR